VQAAHPDLQPNLFANPFEVAGNGIDDDGNGYPDDVSGWDFINAVNTPEPKDAGDGHGVATAGLAAARGNNGIGVSGVAPFCRILPIKIFQGDDFVGSSALANAIRYAAGLTAPAPWRGADVLNMSFGGGAPSLAEDSAFADAAAFGRQGKGCVLVASSGNSASDYYPYWQELAPGTYYFEWRYRKDPAVSFGDDTCRLGLVRFPDGTVERFDQPTPPAGWNFKPEADKPGWIIEDNPAKSYGLGRYQARAQITQNNSYALCRSKPVTFTVTNNIIFYYWISSEASYDFIEFRAVRTDSAPPSFTPVDSGVYPTDPYVAYPASHADVIAVGASTEFDYRSYFSQYGAELDLVAPGGGGLVGIVTTDRTGDDGYASGDVTTQFAGTSASAPIVSGAAALLLSRHPDLTAAAVRSLLRRTADKVGDLAYTDGESGAGGRNDFLGYGRLNAGRLLGLARVTVNTGFGGASATADALTDFFCEPVQAQSLAAQADDYFAFKTWEAAPPANASIFTPTTAATVAAIYDDVTLTATFDPLLAPLGTPLYWLAAHGLTTPDFGTAEADDADADGHAAWQEWLAGTDPGDDASVLRLTAFQRLADGRCVVSWSSVSNRVYDILAYDSPAATEPTVLTQGLTATTPLNVHTTAPLPAAARFIRVRTNLP
jgi:subtilisin family serine protease